MESEKAEITETETGMGVASGLWVKREDVGHRVRNPTCKMDSHLRSSRVTVADTGSYTGKVLRE